MRRSRSDSARSQPVDRRSLGRRSSAMLPLVAFEAIAVRLQSGAIESAETLPEAPLAA